MNTSEDMIFWIAGENRKKMATLNHIEIRNQLFQESYDWFIGNYKNLNVVVTTHKTKLNPKIFKLLDKL